MKQPYWNRRPEFDPEPEPYALATVLPQTKRSTRRITNLGWFAIATAALYIAEWMWLK